MTVSLTIDGTDAAGRTFLTWSPRMGRIRMAGRSGAVATDVVLRGSGTAGLLFDAARTDSGHPTLQLTLPGDGSPVAFWVAGEFQKPSVAYGDAVVEATDAGGQVLATMSCMVRIRKDATSLTAAERDRFLAALGTLNARGSGVYGTVRDMHTLASIREMHGNVGFPPWHRAYVLGFERALQAIDPTVAIPYWRFDRPAPTVFTRDFMGEADPATGRALFRPGHPLLGWVTDGHPGIDREPLFPVAAAPAGLKTEAATLALGGRPAAFAGFHAMELDPHGLAHTSFSGPIDSVPTAVRDPLFFMLHANVDRLWAKWQWREHRHDPADPHAYAPPSPALPGHGLNDTMWPWNGITGGTRPPTAPGGPFPPSRRPPRPARSRRCATCWTMARSGAGATSPSPTTTYPSNCPRLRAERRPSDSGGQVFRPLASANARRRSGGEVRQESVGICVV